MTEDRVRALETRISVLEARIEEYNKALVKQASEYERRLEDLNHAHEIALGVQHTFVSNDKFDKSVENAKTAQDVALLGIGEKINSLENWRAKATGIGIILVVFAGVIGGAIVKAFGG